MSILGAGVPHVCLPVSCCHCHLLEKWHAGLGRNAPTSELGIDGCLLLLFFLCLAWDCRQIFATLWSRKLFRLQARFVDTRNLPLQLCPLPSSWRLSVFGSLLLSRFGGLFLHTPPPSPASEGERASGLCLRPECAGPFSLGLTEGLEAGGWQEREFMERPRFLGD